MKKFLDLISEEMQKGFALAGYEEALGRVTPSNRPDLCEYQCNGAMAGAKRYHKAPLVIAGEVAACLTDSAVFSEVTAAPPGFLNLKLKAGFVKDYVNGMLAEEKFGLEMPEKPRNIVVDYGGANVAKPLHVGHLRPAIIGESIKRICRYCGHKVTGDVHLGDWGTQMGLICMELQKRSPELVYFDESYTGAYPKEPPFTVSDLGVIYPAASQRAKEDPAFKQAALEATVKIQQGVPGYLALWRHIMDVSLPDLKKNYAALDVFFDLWKGESDAKPLIPEMVEDMKRSGLAYESEGALVVDVKEETDTKEIPPCIILKSDGASLYATTDLATIKDRMENLHADDIIYLADKRQEMHFLQVFRTARKAGLVKPETRLVHIPFGTMNGKDGKPFKTREGGVMHLEELIREINEEMYRKIVESRHEIGEEEARQTAQVVGLSALKYGDLSNQAGKDYIFDIDRFTSFEGDTGPYILYTIVRIKSILGRCRQLEYLPEKPDVREAQNALDKDLMMQLASFSAMMEDACEELAPNRVCAYLYDLANAFNRFYHETKIVTEPDKERRDGWISLILLTLEVLEACIGVLGFSAPDRM